MTLCTIVQATATDPSEQEAAIQHIVRPMKQTFGEKKKSGEEK